MFPKSFPILVIILTCLLISCASGTPTLTLAPSIDVTATAEQATQSAILAAGTETAESTAEAERAQATAGAEQTQSTLETALAEQEQSAAETARAEGTSMAAAEQATATAIIQATETKATETAAREATRTAATAQAQASATAQASALSDLAQALYDQEIITRADGIYRVLEDYEYSWAKLNYYQWVFTDYYPTDFILKADLSWESASDTANWWNSGCGYVFRLNEEGDHYLTFLSLDGNVYLYRNINSRVYQIGQWYAGSVDIPKGSATFTLVVDGNWITFFVNGERIHSRPDSSFDKGGLAYVLVSGTNKDFGTWCSWENVELWDLD
jgi:hypothetical protein